MKTDSQSEDSFVRNFLKTYKGDMETKEEPVPNSTDIRNTCILINRDGLEKNDGGELNFTGKFLAGDFGDYIWIVDTGDIPGRTDGINGCRAVVATMIAMETEKFICYTNHYPDHILTRLVRICQLTQKRTQTNPADKETYGGIAQSM